MPYTLAVQTTLLSTSTTKCHHFQLLVFPRSFLTWPQNLLLLLLLQFTDCHTPFLFALRNYIIHHCLHHTPLAFPNLALSLVSLVQNFARHLAITSNTVHKDIWNSQVTNLECRKTPNYYQLFYFHCFTYILFLPIVFDMQIFPPDFTDTKSFFISCHPVFFARQTHT